MKTLTVLIVAIGCVLSANAQTRSVLERGPHHALYSASDGSPGGAPTLVLETGLHYWSPATQEWLPAEPSFSVNATGDAFVADRTLGQLRASAQINTAGAITVNLDPQDPTRQLVTSPVAIAIEEPATGNILVVGAITNSIGALVEGTTNQIIYEDCFAGVCASYVVEVQRGTYSADVLFTGKFDVRDWGFTTNARIQIISEIYGPPPDSSIRRPLYIEQNPQKVAQAARLGLSLDVIDETLGWGNLVMAEGSAYTAATATATNGASVRVAKQIETADGRLFLVESLAFSSLQDQFLGLPPCMPPGGHARLNRPRDAKLRYAGIPGPPSAPVVGVQSASEPAVPATTPQPPLPRPTIHASRIPFHAIPSATPKTALPLQARLAGKPTGVCVDYIANLGGTLSTPVTFQSSTNVLITGSLYLNGPVTFEPIIVKYKANASMQINSTLTLKNFGQFRGAQFTAVDDNSVGDTCAGITNSGYTGVIASTGYANPAIYTAQSSLSLTNCRFSYAKLAVQCVPPLASSSAYNFSHSQLVNCITGIQLSLASCGSGCGCGGGSFACGVTIGLNANNCLIANVTLPFSIGLYNPPLGLSLANCTLDRAARIALLTSGNFSLNATNCIFANITNTSGGVIFAGANNGFYNSAQQFGAARSIVTNSPFQSVGAANYYLTAASGFTNAGTATGIPTWLQADLRQRTTCPPTVICDALLTNDQILSPLVPRDTNVCSLGMHYDPIDWALGWVLVTNATITVNPGTVIAAFGTNAWGTNIAAYGLAIGQNAALQCQGAPNTPNWIVAYNTVQEQGTNSGRWLPPSSGLLVSEFQGLTPASVINCRFTRWSVPSLDEPGFNATTNSGPLNFQDCEFHGGKLVSLRPTIDLTNCLLERVYANLSSADGNSPYIRNSLFSGGIFNFAPNVTNALVKDNLFDQTSIPTNTSIYITYDGGYNAYVTNNARLLPLFATDQILTGTLAYQTGPLGNYYYPTNGPSGGLTNLFDTGSTWALDDGLFYYTTTTNQVPEGGTMVDIGYHYVAVDPNTGQPYDWDHDGIPDYLYDTGSFFEWWLIQWFGRTDIDPYALCSSGDGWTLLQAYQNGWNPSSFYTPPPPQNVAAVLDATGTNATITWTSGGGPVTNYQIWFGSWSTGLNSNTFSFTYNGLIPGDTDINSPFTVRARFANGAYADSEPAYVCAAALSSSMAAVRGPGGQLCVAVGSVPQDLSVIRLYWQVWDSNAGAYVYHSIDLSAASLVNGAAPLPLDQMTGYDPGTWFDAQCIATNGTGGAVADLWPYPFNNGDAGLSGYTVLSFVDTRPHLKENLKFLMRSATLTRPFTYLSGIATPFVVDSPSVDLPEEWYARPASPTNYEYSGYHTFSPNLNFSFLEEARPVRENFLWSNFVFNPSNYGQTGAWFQDQCTPETFLRTLDDPLYEYSGPGTELNPPLALANANARWLFFRLIDPGQDCNFSQEVGIATNSNNKFLLNSGVRNCYGLSFNSAELYLNDLDDLTLLLPGVPSTFSAQDATCYPETAIPGWQTVDYYFASQTPYLNGEYAFWLGVGPLAGPAPPLPGSPTFSVTNTSPLLITGIGQPITVSGWAKLAITNGYSGKYAYLEQYFTNACTMDGNGNVTTNSAGLLSPYGEFFPMQPGPAALVTMPDIDTGQQGTGVVNVIKLQLDVNHDGVMDLSFAGPDNTSQAQPFVFWINNNYDRFTRDDSDQVDYDDDVSSTSQDAKSLYTGQFTPDYNYTDAAGSRIISCSRDLQDFARLWVCGITTNLLTNLPAGTTISLSWGDVGNPNPANPTIDLFKAADADGGVGYLTNSTTGFIQTSTLLCPYTGRLGPGQSIQLNGSQFTNHWAGSYFIWCGVSNGTGGLTLTISQGGTNVLAQTTMYIQLVDIKQMYERWTIGDSPSVPAYTNAVPAEEGLLQPFQYSYNPASDSNTPYALYVHGWNMETWDKDRFAESAFKRLYWQGYQGRFGVFRWPTESGFKGVWTQLARNPSEKDNYDRSEYTAWRSGAALLNKLNDLNRQYPGHVYLLAHSMGNIVAGEALRLAGANQVVNTYVASQAAVSAHTYDTNIPNYSFSDSPWVLQCKTPNIYGNWFEGNYGGGAGTVVSFYNTNDYALQRSAWQLNQLLKPDQYVPIGGSLWDYSYNGLTNDPPPWNHFEKAVSLGVTIVNFDIVNLLTNRYEVMALAAESWTTAFGATPGVQNIRRGVDLSQLWPPDLTHPTHPFDEHFYHSAEFRGDYWQQQGYWRELLGSDVFKLK